MLITQTIESGRLIERAFPLRIHFDGVNLFVKRKLVLITIAGLAIVLLLTSCSSGGLNMWSRFYDDDEEISNARMEKVLEAVKKEDKDALKTMFSKKAISQAEHFDESIVELFDFFQGDLVSYNDWSGPRAEGGINEDGTGRKWKELYSSYDIDTSKQKYRLAIQEFVQDTADADNVGIWSLYIIKMEDDTDPQFGYIGDGKDTPGINFNRKNVLPKEETE